MVWFKRTRKFVSKSTDFEGVKRQQSFLKGVFRFLFKIDKVENPCEFEDLKAKGINDTQIRDSLTTFTWLYRFFAIVAALVFLYTIIMIIRGFFLGSFISGALTCLMLAQSFKYHFWVFQIRSKKLGCTFGEWFNYLTGGSK